MSRTKPFQVSALSPALTALLVASVNTFLANYLHPESDNHCCRRPGNEDKRKFLERFDGRMRKYPIAGATDFVVGEYGCLLNRCGIDR